MNIIKPSYSGNWHAAVMENEAQDRDATLTIKAMQQNVAAECRRISERLESRLLLEPEERVYLELRVMGLEKLASRLANAWAEVAGVTTPTQEAEA